MRTLIFLALASCTYPVTNVVNETIETDAQTADANDPADSSQIIDAATVGVDATLTDGGADTADAYQAPDSGINEYFGRCVGALTKGGVPFDLSCGDEGSVNGWRAEWQSGNFGTCTQTYVQGQACNKGEACNLIENSVTVGVGTCQ